MFLTFSGSPTEEIAIPYNVSHAITGDVEIETVIRILKSNASGVIVGFSGVGTENQNNNTLYALSVSRQRLTVTHEYGNGTGVKFEATGPSNLSFDWIRVRIVRSGLSYSIYVNGTLYHQASFPSNQAPTFAAGGVSTQIRVGNTFISTTTPSRLTNVNVAYVKIKNGSGTVVFELGEDTGGAPGTSPPFMAPRFIDPLDRLFTRPPQNKIGKIDYDPFGFSAERKAQRRNGYILDMTGSGNAGDGSGEVNAPRAYPLETSWQKANPHKFS